MDSRLNRHAGVLALAALCLSLIAAVGGVASATGVLVTSKSIKNGTILSQDIHKSGVKSSDIKTGAVTSSDIGNGDVTGADLGNGEVEPVDVSMPPPGELIEQPGDVATGGFGTAYAVLDVAGTYAKQDPTSFLEVTWQGSAAAGFQPCFFQLRVDGQPAAPGAGEYYLANGSTTSLSLTAQFDGLAAGPHQIEVWAHAATESNVPYTCTVGPAEAGISQTFTIAEQVV